MYISCFKKLLYIVTFGLETQSEVMWWDIFRNIWWEEDSKDTY